ncbi:hypothetical protein ACS0TY_014438 [Phlomoides rotata]
MQPEHGGFISSHKPGIVMVEFDTVGNSDRCREPTYQHIGINENSVVSIVSKPWNATSHDGEIAHVWITYNGTTRNMSVFWNYGGSPNSSLETIVYIEDVLPQFVTVGFSASTGIWNQRVATRSWDFSSSLDDDVTREGENGIDGKKIGLVVGGSVSGCGFIS